MKEITNVFDDPTFFEGYKKLRENPDCANEVEEKPALFSLIGNVEGKSVLDLGCGFGENCGEFLRMGAVNVTGVDISHRMLEGASERYPGVEFICADICDLSFISGKFDVVTSSLALHYVCDFSKLCREVYSLLNDGGSFVFSQEHPMTTAPVGGVSWTKNEAGERIHYNLSDYSKGGKRVTSWMIDGIVKYHRTFSEIVNTLTDSGFAVEKMLEPSPDRDLLRRLPEYTPQLHKPNFLLVKSRKV